MKRYDCMKEICQLIDDCFDKLRHILMEEMLEQGASVDTAAFIVAKMDRPKAMLQLMEYLISIRTLEVSETKLILKALEIRRLND